MNQHIKVYSNFSIFISIIFLFFQPGASLAQDRGRLESTIQTLTSEVNTLKKQLDKEVDTCRIKQTIIESQLDTIQKLKDVNFNKSLIINYPCFTSGCY